LRGSAFDIFGYTQERRTERQLIGDYERLIDEIVERLSPDNHALAVQLAAIPEEIRGFGHVKLRNLSAAQLKQEKLLEQFRTPVDRRAAA
jgi:indolepyruvate ferredoxin oxidoreductase